MTEKINPTKVERRELFRVANFAANVILDDLKVSKSPRNQRFKMIKHLEDMHPALPFVTMQLIRPEVRHDIEEPEHDIRIRKPRTEFEPVSVADGALIIATGLDRTVTVHGREEVLAVHADDNPSRVRFEFVKKLR